MIERALAVTINSYHWQGATYFSNDHDPMLPASLTGVVQSVAGLNNLQFLTPANHGLAQPAFPVYSPGPAVTEGQPWGQDGDGSRLKGALPSITNGAYDPTDVYKFTGLRHQRAGRPWATAAIR